MSMFIRRAGNFLWKKIISRGGIEKILQIWKNENHFGRFLVAVALEILQKFRGSYFKEFDWRPTDSLKRFLYMFAVLSVFLLGELNTFYLKYILWIQPSHFLCLGRLVFMWLVGAVAMRESFEYLDNPYV